MYQVQYWNGAEWVDWAQSPSVDLAAKYASLLNNRYPTRWYRLDRP